MSTILDMGIPGVSSGIRHPKHKNRWRVTFANLGGGTDSIPFSAQLRTFQRPRLTFEKHQLDRYNSRAWILGKHTWEPISLTLEDDILNGAAKAMQEQLQKQQWLIGAEGQWLKPAAEGSLYKFVVYLDNLDGGEVVLERWTLEGAMFETVNWGDLDYVTGEPLTIDVQISYDHARQEFGNYDGPGQALGGQGRTGPIEGA